MEFLTPDEEIDLIKARDQNVEIVAFVESKNAPMECGRNKEYTVMKFILNNKQRKQRIRCSLWGEDIPIIEPFIQTGKIIHVNGANALLAKPTFNKGNVLFELSMKKNTEVTILDDLQNETTIEVDPVDVKLEDLANWINQYVVVEAYLKSPFKVVSNYSLASYGCAAICDNGYKCDIKISTYDPSQLTEDSTFVTGEALMLKGYPREETDKYNVKRLFLDIASIKDIQKRKKKSFFFSTRKEKFQRYDPVGKYP